MQYARPVFNFFFVVTILATVVTFIFQQGILLEDDQFISYNAWESGFAECGPPNWISAGFRPLDIRTFETYTIYVDPGHYEELDQLKKLGILAQASCRNPGRIDQALASAIHDGACDESSCTH